MAQTFVSLRRQLTLPGVLCVLLLGGCANFSPVNGQPPEEEAAPAPRRKAAGQTETQQRFQLALGDLTQTLKEMSGREWTASAAKDEMTTVGDGARMTIQLALSTSPLAPRDAVQKLKDKGREPFMIRSDGKEKLWIIANGQAGLSHGIYYYLDQLGARWFFPGAAWTIIPKRQDVSLQIDALVAPAFVNRRMGGTGGFGSIPYDREGRNRNRWNDWQRRNRFGSEFIVGGHSYGQFVQRHRKIFDEHPEYFASVGGKRAIPESELKYMGAKFDPSNPAVVKLYVEDRLSEFRKARALDPDGPLSVGISVEPSDGAGFCDSEECLKIGGPSEQVFFVANEVAKAIRKEFPGAIVGLYAYNLHSSVPKIPIEPNVHVMVTPYGFNRSGLSPERLIEAWSQKTTNLGMREYWSIPDWANDLPSLNFVKTPAEKIRLWRRFGVNSLVAESSYSAGAVGPAWIIGSRLLWNPDADEKEILADFYEKSFGPAAPPMKRMLERWASGFRLISSELGLSFRDLNEAMKLAEGNPGVLARLDDYGRYLQFLRLRYEMDMTERGPEREAAMIAYLQHLNNIYDSSMVTVVRLNQLLLSKYPDGPLRKKYLIWSNKEGDGWKERVEYSHDDILKLLAAGAQNYQPLEGAATINYEGEWTLVSKPQFQAGKFGPIMLNRNAKFLFLPPPGAKSLTIKLSGKQSLNVTISDAEGETIYHQVKTEGKEDYATAPEDFEIPIANAGLHRIEIRISSTEGFAIAAPTGVPFVMDSYQTRSGTPSPRLYFWVPRGLKSAALYFPYSHATRRPRVFDGDGKLIQFQDFDNGKILVMPVAAGQDGKAWSVEGVVSAGNGSPQGLNVPQAWAFSPDALMVPADALR